MKSVSNKDELDNFLEKMEDPEKWWWVSLFFFSSSSSLITSTFSFYSSLSFQIEQENLERQGYRSRCGAHWRGAWANRKNHRRIFPRCQHQSLWRFYWFLHWRKVHSPSLGSPGAQISLYSLKMGSQKGFFRSSLRLYFASNLLFLNYHFFL